MCRLLRICLIQKIFPYYFQQVMLLCGLAFMQGIEGHFSEVKPHTNERVNVTVSAGQISLVRET